MRDATGQLSNRVHLLRLMQLLFKTTPLCHVMGADNDAAGGARLLRRRRNNGLDHLVALDSLISVRRSGNEARSELGSDFRRALRAQDRFDCLADHVLSGLPIEPQSGRIGLRVPETALALFHDDGVAFR